VLVGTALSTVGVVTAALLFLHVITQPTRQRLRRRAERAAQEATRAPAAVAAPAAVPVVPVAIPVTAPVTTPTAPDVVVLPAASAIPTQRSARSQTPEDRRG